MRAHTVALAAMACGLLASGVAGADSADSSEVRAIDVAKSNARFTVTHVFVEHVTGTVRILRGSVTLPPHSLIPQSVSAVLDAAKTDSGNSDRDDALRSPDFFDVKQFPTWTFTSTVVTRKTERTFGLDGMLTIHGVARPQHLEVTVRGDASHPVYDAIGQVDRHAFGMPVTRLDPAIGSAVDLTLTIVLDPPPAPGGTSAPP